MSSVLYYSKYCENCKKLLYELGKTNVQKNVHFLSIDKRINRGDKTYIKLDNGHEIFMPPNITQVPSLLLLTKGNKIVVGGDVMNYFKPQIYQEKVQATENNMEPLAFSMVEMGTSMSDTYSYLDQSPDEMNAKGEGGLRQMHSFVKLHENESIETPPEDYIADKVGEVDMGKLQAERDAEITQSSPSKSFN